MATLEKVLAEKGSEVYSIEPSETVYDAVTKMVEHNCGALLVMEGEDVVGIVTERDYLRKVALQGQPLKTTAVRDIMTGTLVIGEAGTTIDEALALMTDRRIRHLPVFEEGALVGLVSIGDLVKHKTKEQAFRIRYLEEYITAR